jgi:hypothetical protein
VARAEDRVNATGHRYKYILVAQAFSLAMTHFRRALQSMGLDARN